jgi:hypothetical protein
MKPIPVGEIRVSWHTDPDSRNDWFEVVRADPVIQVTAKFLAEARLHCEMAQLLGRKPWLTLENGVLSFWPTSTPSPVVYREVAYDEEKDLYTFCWPD